jgi:hypothetical protein
MRSQHNTELICTLGKFETNKDNNNSGGGRELYYYNWKLTRLQVGENLHPIKILLGRLVGMAQLCKAQQANMIDNQLVLYPAKKNNPLHICLNPKLQTAYLKFKA